MQGGALNSIMPHTYHVEFFKTRFFSGTADPERLKKTLNRLGQEGWMLERTIAERKRVFLLFSREVHILIFRFVGADPKPELMRQLLRAYGHEPVA
jgi:hypothetical protein